MRSPYFTLDTPLRVQVCRLTSRRFPAGAQVVVLGQLRGTSCYLVRLLPGTAEAYALLAELSGQSPALHQQQELARLQARVATLTQELSYWKSLADLSAIADPLASF